jgi:hypothetical protein
MPFSSAEHFRQSALPQTFWTFGEIAGRFVEISGSAASASLTLVFGMVGEAQRRGEPVAWIMSDGTSFYPPDVARRGIDLAALVVVRLRSRDSIPRAGEKLLRSSAFGLVVLDLQTADISMPLQTRLTGLAHRHHTGLICVTEKPRTAFSIGSLVSLRAHAERVRDPRGHFTCMLRIVKDKRRGPTWNHEAFYSGPAGLC